SAIAGPIAVAMSLALAGCAGAPPKQARVEPLACPPPAAPACPAPATPATPPARGKLEPAAWADLPEWRRESLRPALDAFVRGCPAIEKREGWKAICVHAQAVAASAPPEEEIAAFLESR